MKARGQAPDLVAAIAPAGLADGVVVGVPTERPSKTQHDPKIRAVRSRLDAWWPTWSRWRGRGGHRPAARTGSTSIAAAPPPGPPRRPAAVDAPRPVRSGDRRVGPVSAHIQNHRPNPMCYGKRPEGAQPDRRHRAPDALLPLLPLLPRDAEPVDRPSLWWPSPRRDRPPVAHGLRGGQTVSFPRGTLLIYMENPYRD
jgi:hypothetical protein